NAVGRISLSAAEPNDLFRAIEVKSRITSRLKPDEVERASPSLVNGPGQLYGIAGAVGAQVPGGQRVAVQGNDVRREPKRGLGGLELSRHWRRSHARKLQGQGHPVLCASL